MAMRKITFSGDEGDIELASESAREQKTVLNELFHTWLREMAERQKKVRGYRALMDRLMYVNPGRKFTREEMNER
jgi:hypothetical protein